MSGPRLPLAVELVADGARRAAQLGEGDRWHMVKGVDLAMRMGNGGAHLAPTVLEDKDVVDVWPGAKGFCSGRPQRDHQTELVLVERAQALGVLGREQHNFAPLSGQGWPAVLEPAHVVRLRRLEAARAERAGLDAREVWAVLPPARDDHGDLAERVQPDIWPFLICG